MKCEVSSIDLNLSMLKYLLNIFNQIIKNDFLQIYTILNHKTERITEGCMWSGGGEETKQGIGKENVRMWVLEVMVWQLFIGTRILHGIQKIEHKNIPELLGSIPVSIVWRKVKVWIDHRVLIRTRT